MKKSYIAAALLGLWLLVGVLDRQSLSSSAVAVRDADQRKEFTPQQLADIGYWRRHERHKRACRGQTYIATCCDSSFDAYEVTCLKPEDIR